VKFIVAHPGTQHSVRAALGLKQAGLLRFFLTSLSLKRPPGLGAILRVVVPNAYERLVQHRAHEGLYSKEIRVAPLHLVATKIGPRAWMASRRRFGRLAGRLGVRERCGVMAFDGNAAETFKILKEEGLPCILDQTIAHRRWSVRVGQAECEAFPEWGDRWGATEELMELEEEEQGLADTILCGSQFCADTMSAEGVSADKLQVVEYGANTSRFSPLVGARADGPVRLLFVGALNLRKGFHYYAKVAASLEGLDVQASAAGSLRVRPETLAPYLGVLKILGRRLYADMPEVYRSHDIYVFPTLVEGSSLSIYEALASGLPVVTTPNAGSIVRDGVEGFVVPARDPEALHLAVERLVRDPELRREMGRAARLRALAIGDWAHYGMRLAEAVVRRHGNGRLEGLRPT
jgi:alpha-maltose-1-phosphate synthase